MHAALRALSSEERKLLRKRARPRRFDPMLAKLTDEPFSDAEWIYERKFDGERALLFASGRQVRLRSRNDKAISVSYPEIVEAAQRLRLPDLIADGEIVAFEGRQTSFSHLQARMHVRDEARARATGVTPYYYLFDLVRLDGYDLRKLPLRTRKRILKRAIRFRDPLRYSSHRNEHGERYLREACRKGWEGLIAKLADSEYAPSRSSHWQKLKCVRDQEFVIGGYTEPKGSRTGLGAILVGYYRRGKLQYAGKVGTGFGEEELRSLAPRLRRASRRASPFADAVREAGVHWVQPRFVCQVGFTEWTREGRLRHPRYQGLRRDKSPKDVRREAS